MLAWTLMFVLGVAVISPIIRLYQRNRARGEAVEILVTTLFQELTGIIPLKYEAICCGLLDAPAVQVIFPMPRGRQNTLLINTDSAMWQIVVVLAGKNFIRDTYHVMRTSKGEKATRDTYYVTEQGRTKLHEDILTYVRQRV